MRFDMTGVEPVAIALDRIEAEGALRFSGLDLESGARVVVTIEREEATTPTGGGAVDLGGLVLVLTLGCPTVAA